MFFSAASWLVRFCEKFRNSEDYSPFDTIICIKTFVKQLKPNILHLLLIKLTGTMQHG
jgi:hypothetical protein